MAVLPLTRFRMVLPSGEVETFGLWAGRPARYSSGWFFRPGKLKPETGRYNGDTTVQVPDGSSVRGS